MTNLLPDLFRSFVTTIMLVVLLFTLAQPKFDKKIHMSALIIIVATNVAKSMCFYLEKDYTTLAKFDILFFIIIGIAVKPLFKEGIMQWLFNCMTVMNVYAIVVVLSYYLCDLFPYPYYAHTILRFVMFFGVIMMFHTRMRPLYQKAAERWDVYLLVASGIFLNFGWYFFAFDDVEEMLCSQFVPLIFLIFLALLVYVAIFLSLKAELHEIHLKEENLKIQNNNEILEISTQAMKKSLSIMDETVRQMSIVQHDRRHFNAALLELIHHGEIERAQNLINRQTAVLPIKPQKYCENVAVNAVVSYYIGIAEQKGITCNVCLNIPIKLQTEDLELSMVISNLLENAIHAVEKAAGDRYIRFTAIFTGQLILEIENPYDGEIETDENGCPVSMKQGHGMGMQSVLSFVKKNNVDFIYNFTDEIFKVRLLI